MPCFKAYSNGITLGVPPTNNNHVRAKRGKINGWSESATRRNTAFLYSVDVETLKNLHGYAFTGTVRTLPDSFNDWARIVKIFMQRINRMDVNLYHHVTEFQKRVVPHLHGMFYFEAELSADQMHALKIHWIDCVCTVTGDVPDFRCQTLRYVDSAIGWVQYLGKHGSRGLKNYQRATVPKSWERTGRMWGKGGKWPTRLAEGEIELSHFHRFRRLAKRWRLADARIEPDLKKRPARISYARKMLKNPIKNLSTVRGISEWIPEDLSLLMLQTTEENYASK